MGFGRSQKTTAPKSQIFFRFWAQIKFSDDEYVINKDYASKLRSRMSIFKTESKTRKGLALTFITTYGVKPNLYSNMVQSQVTLEDLFLP